MSIVKKHLQTDSRVVRTCEDGGKVGPDGSAACSARLPAVRAPQMVSSAIVAAIGGSLVPISTPTEHNEHNTVCSVSLGVVCCVYNTSER